MTADLLASGLLDGLAAWPGARLLQDSGTAYLLVNAAHILGLALLIGAIVPLDLALMGALRQTSAAAVAPLLLRSAAIGLGLTLATGAWLFTVKPHEYVANPAFLVKLGLLAAALVNIALQHRRTAFQAALRGEPVAAPVRIGAAASLVLWLAALLAGRWIGFL